MMRTHATRPQCYSLEGIAIFAGLPKKRLEHIRKGCTWRRYKPRESIVDYLDTSDDVFFITAGEARVTIYSQAGKAISFGQLGPGEVVGEYAAVDQWPRSASVEAQTDCIVASMPAGAFRTLLETEPAVTLALLTQLVKRTRSITRRVYELSTLHVDTRIQSELLRLASLAPRDGKSARIIPAPTHVEIANRISTNREAVTRELNRLLRMGLIERRDDSLLILDVDCLAQMIQDVTGEPFLIS
jgi:CRP/FNR family cyclic AMP-dependent transcriptional regulator